MADETGATASVELSPAAVLSLGSSSINVDLPNTEAPTEAPRTVKRTNSKVRFLMKDFKTDVDEGNIYKPPEELYNEAELVIPGISSDTESEQSMSLSAAVEATVRMKRLYKRKSASLRRLCSTFGLHVVGLCLFGFLFILWMVAVTALVSFAIPLRTLHAATPFSEWTMSECTVVNTQVVRQRVAQRGVTKSEARCKLKLYYNNANHGPVTENCIFSPEEWCSLFEIDDTTRCYYDRSENPNNEKWDTHRQCRHVIPKKLFLKRTADKEATERFLTGVIVVSGPIVAIPFAIVVIVASVTGVLWLILYAQALSRKNGAVHEQLSRDDEDEISSLNEVDEFGIPRVDGGNIGTNAVQDYDDL